MKRIFNRKSTEHIKYSNILHEKKDSEVYNYDYNYNYVGFCVAVKRPYEYPGKKSIVRNLKLNLQVNFHNCPVKKIILINSKYTDLHEVYFERVGPVETKSFRIFSCGQSLVNSAFRDTDLIDSVSETAV